MEILGVGAQEIIFILIIALIILGPKDMQKAGKTIGRWLRKVITSDGWKVFQQTSRELRTLPNRLMREANEELGDVREIGKELKGAADLIKDTSQNPGGSHTSYKPMPINPPPLVPQGARNAEPSVAPDSKADESDPKVDA